MSSPISPATAPGRDAAALRALLADFRALHPRAYLRDAAAALGVSEAELFVADGDSALVELKPDKWQDVIHTLPSLGRVKTMTRNDAAVIERQGRYEQIEFRGHAGQVVGAEIELRIFPSAWASGYAFADYRAGQGVRRSLQFFDKQGVSIHKLYLGDESDVAAYDAIVERFGVTPTSSPTIIPPKPGTERPDSEVDVEALRAAWDTLHHSHEFFDMLRTFNVTRTQALRLAGESRAYQVSPASTEKLLTAASESEMPIMIFVGNRGMIQIHIGPVRRVVRMNDWLNVLDPGFNLHLRENLVASAWVVKKASDTGTVTSLELFDAAGDVIALFFSKRPDNAEESAAWRSLVRDKAEGVA
jgi:putative hemin transport protein